MVGRKKKREEKGIQNLMLKEIRLQRILQILIEVIVSVSTYNHPPTMKYLIVVDKSTP